MRSRFLPVLLVVALTVALAGCLVQSTIDEKGGGTMKVELRGDANGTVDRIKAGFQGPGVTITNATMDEKKNAVVEFTYTDFRTLGALKQFGNTVFTMTDDEKAKTRTASAVVKADKPVQLSDDQLKSVGKDLTVSVTVPGEIVKTTGKQKGKSVTWTIPINTLLGGKETAFSVTYKNSGAPLAALPAAAAAAKSADAAPASAAATTPQPKK